MTDKGKAAQNNTSVKDYCLYIKRLSDIELPILEQIVQQSYEYIKSQDGHIHRILWQTEK
jgi:hypothetical protein